MKPQSAKQKGRRLQQHVRDRILESFPSLQPDDVRSTSMGASGEDILLSPVARELVPFSIEVKNQQRVNIWSALEQAASGEHPPMVVFSRNRSEVYAALRFEDLLHILSALRGSNRQNELDIMVEKYQYPHLYPGRVNVGGFGR